MIRNKIPVVSFFTGGGFLDLGFEEAGFETVWYNEFNSDFSDMFECAMSTLRKKRNNSVQTVAVNSKDSVIDVRSAQVKAEAFCGSPPQFYGVIGGPPCPDFSSGGKHRGHEGDRGRLSMTYIDMVCKLRPSFFVMENVPGLVLYRKHRAFFELLRYYAHLSGFVTDFRVLNALNYGVPQNRNRVFLIGISRDAWHAIRKNAPLPKSDGWFPFPKPIYADIDSFSWPGTSKFGLTPPRPRGIPNELMTKHWLQNAGVESGLPNCDEYFTPYSSKFRTVCEGDDSGKSFKRLHRYRYSPTACYGNNEVHLHPWEPRRLSVREALRIQTVPDYYVLPTEKALTAKFKLIANGVPVALARILAMSIQEFFADDNTN